MVLFSWHFGSNYECPESTFVFYYWVSIYWIYFCNPTFSFHPFFWFRTFKVLPMLASWLIQSSSKNNDTILLTFLALNYECPVSTFVFYDWVSIYWIYFRKPSFGFHPFFWFRELKCFLLMALSLLLWLHFKFK